jgi:hypothetical protein
LRDAIVVFNNGAAEAVMGSDSCHSAAAVLVLAWCVTAAAAAAAARICRQAGRLCGWLLFDHHHHAV